MPLAPEEMEELNVAFPGVVQAAEGGVDYIFVPDLHLPAGTKPEKVDALLCPSAQKHGYPSRLFFAERLQSTKTLNWNPPNGVRILERIWHAYSWKINQTGLRLIQLAAIHLKALQ
jgi:hypothetical protein